MVFRELRANEISVRVNQCTENGCSLLLYKTARVDADILDETVGAENWTCRFYEVGGIMFCSIGVRMSKDEKFIYKDDCGSEGNIEKEKSLASSCFKRAGSKWGIGRSLYTAPFIWIPADKCNIKQGRNGKPQCYDRFSVEKVRTENGEITGLSIFNCSTGRRVFTWVKEER